MPNESSITIGSMIATVVITVIMLGILQPVALAMGVFNPISNSTNPAGNYITGVFGTGPNSLVSVSNASVAGAIPYASKAGNQSINATSTSQLAITSGFAFVAGGLGTFFHNIYNFPKFIYTIFTYSLNYPGLLKFFPIDALSLIAVGILGYVTIVISMKIISLISKPGASVENL